MHRALALFLLGCHPIQPFEAPPPPSDDVRSAIVAFEAEELDVFALELGETDPLTRPFAARENTIITLLYLAHDLPTMQLPAGRIAPSIGGPERSLPPFSTAYQTFEEDGVLRWQEIDRLSARLARFRLRGFTVEECASLGGCYLDREGTELEDCTLPCPVEAPALPEPSEPPLSPSFEPCPAGWMSRTIESIVVCEPSTCPSEKYAPDLPEDAILVDPESDLAAAIANAPAGATIGLARGTHRASATIDRSLKIRGACASETIIELAPDESGFVVEADLELSDLTVRGGTALISSPGATTLERVVLKESADRAIASLGGSIVARDLIVRDTVVAIDLFDATATLSRVLVERAPPYGLVAGSSTVSAEDLVIAASSVGMNVFDSRFSAARAVLIDAEHVAVTIRKRSDITISDLSIDRVAAPNGFAAGLEMFESSSGTIDRFEARGVDGEALRAGADTVLTVEDVSISRDGPTPDQLANQCGMTAFGKANVTAERVHLERLFRQGLCAYGSSRVTASDVTAIDVGDHALYAFHSGSLAVRRALVDGAADGVVAFLTTTLDVEDLTVRRMHGNVRYVPTTMLGYPRGRGIYNNAMARVRVERFHVSGCADAGLDLSSRDAVQLANGVVTDNQVGARITYEPKHLLHRLTVSGNRLNFAAE